MGDDVLTNRWWASRIDCWLRFSPSTLKNTGQIVKTQTTNRNTCCSSVKVARQNQIGTIPTTPGWVLTN